MSAKSSVLYNFSILKIYTFLNCIYYLYALLKHIEAVISWIFLILYYCPVWLLLWHHALLCFRYERCVSISVLVLHWIEKLDVVQFVKLALLGVLRFRQCRTRNNYKCLCMSMDSFINCGSNLPDFGKLVTFKNITVNFLFERN